MHREHLMARIARYRARAAENRDKAAGPPATPWDRNYYQGRARDDEIEANRLRLLLDAMPPLAADELGFVTALAADEDDGVARAAYTDWLDEHDRPEEADRHRAWPAHKRWLLDFVRKINYGPYLVDADGNHVVDDRGEYVHDPDPDNLGEPHTYQHAVDAGHAAVDGGDYTWGSDAGSDFFRPYRFQAGEGGDPAAVGRTNSEEFFRHWSAVTGVPVPEAVAAAPPFRCSC